MPLIKPPYTLRGPPIIASVARSLVPRPCRRVVLPSPLTPGRHGPERISLEHIDMGCDRIPITCEHRPANIPTHIIGRDWHRRIAIELVNYKIVPDPDQLIGPAGLPSSHSM